MKRGSMGLMSVVLATAMLVSACGGSKAPAGGQASNAPAPSTQPAANAKPIKIGQIIPLTGEIAESGKYQKQGAELAMEQVNAKGGVNGRKIELKFEDDQGTNPGAVSAVQKLLEDKEITALIGPIKSTQVQALAPTILDAKIPMAIGGTNYTLTRTNNPWLFRFRPDDGISTQVIAKFIVEELKLKKIAIVHGTDAFGTGARDMLLQALKKYDITPVVVQGTNNGEKDFTATVAAVKQSGAEALITYLAFSTDIGILGKQIKQLGLKLAWIGSSTIAAVDARNLAGDALFGTYGVADFHTESSQAAKDFTAAYKAKYGVEPDLYASWSYDAVRVLAEAMKKAPDLKPESIRQATLAIKNLDGANGTYTFDPNGDGLHSYNIVQNQNGAIKLFKTVSVQ